MRYSIFPLFFVLLSGFFFIGINESFETSWNSKSVTPLNSWTLMFYLDGDCDCERSHMRIMNTLESTFIADLGIDIVAIYDRHPGYDSTNGNWTEARYYHIVPDDNDTLLVSTVEQNLGEVNMGESGTLENFVTWAMSTFPAENYMLDIANHGGGLRGICIDQTDGDILTLDEVQTAMRNAKVDLVRTSACWMGLMEVAYEWSSFADYILFSEWLEYSSRIQAQVETAIPSLCADPTLNPVELADIMATAYMNTDYFGMTQSVVNLTKTDNLANKLSDLADILSTELPGGIIRLAEVRSRMGTIDGSVDIGEMCLELISNYTDNSAIQDAAQNVLDATNDAVVVNYYKDDYDYLSGLRVQFPQDTRYWYWEPYVYQAWRMTGLDFLSNTSWVDFIANYLNIAPMIDTPGIWVDQFLEENQGYEFDLCENQTMWFDIDIDSAGVYNFVMDIDHGEANLELWEVSFFPFHEVYDWPYSYVNNSLHGSEERIQCWLEPSRYMLGVIPSGAANGTISYNEEPIETFPVGTTLTVDYPASEFDSYIIQTVAHYFLINMEVEYNLTIVSTQNLSFFLNIWNVDRSERFLSFFSEPGESFTYNTNQSQIFIEIGGFMGSGSFSLSLVHSTISTSQFSMTTATSETTTNTQPTPSTSSNTAIIQSSSSGFGIWLVGVSMVLSGIILLYKRKVR